MLRAHCAVVLLCVGLVACKRSQPEARKVVPPTEQEAEAFGKEFVKQMSPCNVAGIDRLVDRDLVLARAVAKRKLTDRDTESFKRGFGGVGQILCRELLAERNVAVSYLRVKMIDGTPRPVARLIMDGALNYYEVELDKRDNKVRAADISFYMAGEGLSDLVGTMLDLVLGARSELTKLTGTMDRVTAHMTAREFQAAYDAWKTLPPAFRAAKPMRLLEIQITSELGDEAYLAAMESYAKAFPGDPSLALVQIDRAILRKEFDQAFRYIDELDKRVGGDPYLDVMRADALSAQGKPAEALEAATRASKHAPDVVASWWQLLTQQTANARYADATITLAVLRDRFAQDITAETLRHDARFGGLLESPEYAAWAAP